MPTTRASRKRNEAALSFTSNKASAPTASSSKRACRRQFNLESSTTKTQSNAKNVTAKPAPRHGQGRSLSMARSRPINISEVHSVTNLYVQKAFNLRAITEQFHRHSMSLVRRQIVRRLQYLKEQLIANAATTVVDERSIRKNTRILKETLGHLRHYLRQEEQEQTTGNDISNAHYINVLVTGLETLVAVLESSEHFRQTLVAERGWDILMELLRRHDGPLRRHVCQILVLLFVSKGQFPTDDEQLTPALFASDQSWNHDIAERIAKDDCCSIIFADETTSKWGLYATRYTMELMIRTSYTLGETREGRLRHAHLVTVSFLDLSARYRARADYLMARVQDMRGTFDALSEERNQLGIDIRKAKASYQRFLATNSRDAQALEELRIEWQGLETRHLANAARLDEYKAAYALLE